MRDLSKAGTVVGPNSCVNQTTEEVGGEIVVIYTYMYIFELLLVHSVVVDDDELMEVLWGGCRMEI